MVVLWRCFEDWIFIGYDLTGIVGHTATVPCADVSDRHGILGLRPKRAGRLLK